MHLRSLGATALACGALLVGAGPALAGDDSAKYRKAVDVTSIKLHETAFNLIAEVSGGNRLAGAPGHARSADYVDLQARLAGLKVSRQDFNTTCWRSATGSGRSSTSNAASATSRASPARSSAATSARWSTRPRAT